MNNNLKWWKSPYSLSQKIDFIKYRLLSPKKAPTYLPPVDLQEIGRGTSVFSPEPKEHFSILFTGDLMPFGDNIPLLSDDIDEFIDQSDYIVFNLEGVATEENRFLALSHSPAKIIEYLKRYNPGKVVLNVANNHSSDFGADAFQKQNTLLRDNGFLVVGDNETPLVLEGCVSLFASTFLSNQSLLASISSSIDTKEHSLQGSHYNIFMPHWGYEMHLHPTEEQLTMGQNLVPKVFDAIIGNHSHTPHPIYRIGRQHILATSLGNFCYKNMNPNHWIGSLLKLSFTKNHLEEKVILSKVEVRYSQQNIVNNQIFITETNSIDYKRIRAGITFLDKNYIKDIIK